MKDNTFGGSSDCSRPDRSRISKKRARNRFGASVSRMCNESKKDHDGLAEHPQPPGPTEVSDAGELGKADEVEQAIVAKA